MYIYFLIFQRLKLQKTLRLMTTQYLIRMLNFPKEVDGRSVMIHHLDVGDCSDIHCVFNIRVIRDLHVGYCFDLFRTVLPVNKAGFTDIY